MCTYTNTSGGEVELNEVNQNQRVKHKVEVVVGLLLLLLLLEDMPEEERPNSSDVMKEEEEEEEVTLSDVIQHNEHMTETADAVLGDASDTNCSYPMGYIRQAVYACMTCTPDARADPTTRAGVCLACTYNCHQDHELVELYTKRMFRCDCGNDKFPKRTDAGCSTLLEFFCVFFHLLLLTCCCCCYCTG